MYLVCHFANAYEQNSPFHPKTSKKISRIFGGQLIHEYPLSEKRRVLTTIP
jgi:hypothetical protein